MNEFTTYIMDFIIGEALIVVPVLIILGKFIKDTPRVKDWLIPYILLGIGTGITFGLLGEVSVDAFVQGVLVSGAAVFGNQLWKQTMEGVKQING